jgi:hypothetical protein
VPKKYLGDGVFIEEVANRGGLVLTTEDGYGITNTIFLEPEVVIALVVYIEEMAKKS